MDDKLGPEPSNRFLDYIIHRGKKLYILSRLIPEIQDTVLFEFTPAQLKWCNETEQEYGPTLPQNNCCIIQVHLSSTNMSIQVQILPECRTTLRE